jgi:hypothetical protein
MKELVTLIREYATESYWRYSWDIVADEWSDEQIAETIAGARTRRGALAKVWGKLQLIDQKRRRGSRPVRPQSLFEFLARRGGLRHHPDLTYILDGNPLIPRFGTLLRARGMSLDRAREACVEAGYLHDAGLETGGPSESSTNDLLDAIAEEAHGSKRYAMGDELKFPTYQQPQQETADEVAY